MTATLARLAGCTLLALPVAAPVTAQHGHAAVPESVEVPPDGVELPMMEFGGRPVVEVTIADQGPFRFILDTGADISVVDAALSRELSLPGLAPGIVVAAGGGDPPPAVSIRELHVGDAILHGVIAAVMPLATLLVGKNAPRGVLSAASFPGHLLTYDLRAKRIAIAEGELGAADSSGIFQYLASDALPTVPIRIAGREVRVHVDTGSASGLTLPARFLREIELASEPRVSGKVKTPLGESSCSCAEVKGPVELGPFRLAPGEVEFADVQSGSDQPVGQIGCRVLRDFLVTLDSSHRRIRFARPE